MFRDLIPRPTEVHVYKYTVTVTVKPCSECKGSGEDNYIDEYGSRKYVRCHKCNGHKTIETETYGQKRRVYAKKKKRKHDYYKDRGLHRGTIRTR